VIFAHDTETALAATAALVNSAEPPDSLTSIEALDDFLIEHRFSGSRTGDQVELDSVRALRPALRALLTADRDRAVELANGILADARALPQLVRHDGWDWHLHVVGPDRPLATRMAVEAAMAMIDVIRADELSRISHCARESCDGVVVDLSRNRSRRYCSLACGNRSAVAAYRARRAHPDLQPDPKPAQ
jgi:predicted RNA-binding Zn ribbon-like protein